MLICRKPSSAIPDSVFTLILFPFFCFLPQLAQARAGLESYASQSAELAIVLGTLQEQKDVYVGRPLVIKVCES